jgi:hypothetical protein
VCKTEALRQQKTEERGETGGHEREREREREREGGNTVCKRSNVHIDVCICKIGVQYFMTSIKEKESQLLMLTAKKIRIVLQKIENACVQMHRARLLL